MLIESALLVENLVKSGLKQVSFRFQKQCVDNNSWVAGLHIPGYTDYMKQGSIQFCCCCFLLTVTHGRNKANVETGRSTGKENGYWMKQAIVLVQPLVSVFMHYALLTEPNV